ncbi:MAG: cytosine permease [Candidatus Hecatellaceae archaeon]
MSEPTAVEKEVLFNVLPARSKERIYGFIDFMAIQICFGIAAWFFLVGSLTGLTLPAAEAIPTVLFGNCFPLFLIAPMAVIFARYGVEQFTGSRGVLGHRFTDIWFWIYITSSFGWIAYASFLFGEAAIKFTAFMHGPEILSVEVPGASIYAFIATIIGTFIAYLGPAALKWFMRVAAAFLLGVLLYFIWFIFAIYGIEEIFAKQPVEPIIIDKDPTMSLLWSRSSALEWNVGLGFSWAFWYGQWTRLSKSESHAYHGCLWGWSALAAISGVFAALTAIAVGAYDPTLWIVEISKQLQQPAYAAIGLILMAVANITSVAALVYPMSIAFRSRYPQIKWVTAVLICSVPAFFLESTPDVFYGYGYYLSIIALLTGIYGGLMMADYYVVTKGTWKLREFYNRKLGYRYAGGFNPAAVIATVVGTAFYLTTLNPLTWESPNGLFPYISAGIPTFAITFVIYAVLMKAWVLKKYPPPIQLPTK